MKIVAQLIDKKTGRRTPPVARSRADFANALRDLYVSNRDAAYVLILADDSVEPDNLEFALAPLMTVETFIEHFATKNDLLDSEPLSVSDIRAALTR